MATATNAPAIPFKIASRVQNRQAFTPNAVSLGSSSVSVSPIEIPATGYLRNVRFQVSAAYSGATGTPTFKADATSSTVDGPFNIISTIGVRSADGTPLITPMTGYQLYLINKYGGQTFTGRTADPKNAYGYNATLTATSGTITFFLTLPFEFDHETGLGAIPALASNRSYIVDITLSSIATVFTAGATSPNAVSVTITGTSEYWAQPAAANSLGQAQQTAPQALGTLARWQLETPVVGGAGARYIKSTNVGGTLRTHILVARNSTGGRVVSSTDWPAVFQLYLDNEPQFYYTLAYFQDMISRVYGYDQAINTAAGIDDGVFVLPYFVLNGGLAGDPNNSRGQLLNTNSASLLQFYGANFGSGVNTLEIITNTVSGAAAAIYSR